jgi:hypothetical protein
MSKHPPESSNLGRESNEHLYLDEKEVAKFVLGTRRAKEWPARSLILERRGLPQIDPIMGGRYRPAVKAFFDRLNGLTDRQIPARADGAEGFECRPKSSPSRSKSARPALSGEPEKTASVFRIGSPPRKP